jgi:hypothetical protein
LGELLFSLAKRTRLVDEQLVLDLARDASRSKRLSIESESLALDSERPFLERECLSQTPVTRSRMSLAVSLL